MIDTNALPNAQAAAAAVQSTFNAWHVVALGAGGMLMHGYHTVVNGGGMKKIWSAFWNGAPDKSENPKS